MILHWHEDMDVIMGAYPRGPAPHKPGCQCTWCDSARDLERISRLKQALAEAVSGPVMTLPPAAPGPVLPPVPVREIAPGRWETSTSGTHLLTPQYKDGGLCGWTLIPVPAAAGPPLPATPGGPFAVLGAELPGDRADANREAAEALEARDPAAEILLALAEPLGLDEGELRAAVPDQPAGTCRSCRQPVPLAPSAGLCWACKALAASRPHPVPPGSRPEPPPPARSPYARRNLRLGAGTALISGGFVALILSVQTANAYLLLAGILLFLLGVRGLRR